MIQACVTLVSLAASLGPDTLDPRFGPRFATPGIQRFVSSDGSATLEVRVPDTREGMPDVLDCTYRLVRRATSRARVPSEGYEADYAPLEDGDVALSVGAVVARPWAAAVFPGDGGGGFGILTWTGLDVVGADGALRASVSSYDLNRSSDARVEFGAPDALTSGSPFFDGRHNGGQVLVAVDGALLLADWQGSLPSNGGSRWSLRRIDAVTGAVTALDPDDLPLDAAQLRACEGAEVLIEFAARASRRDLLREVCDGSEYSLGARLRAAWHLGEERRGALEALVVTALDAQLAGSAEPHVVALAVAAGRTLRSSAVVSRALELRRRAAHVDSYLMAGMDQVLVGGGALAFDLVAA